MREQRISIDISPLTIDQLRALQTYARFNGDTETVDTIGKRIDYRLHRLPEEEGHEYYKKYIKD